MKIIIVVEPTNCNHLQYYEVIKNNLQTLNKNNIIELMPKRSYFEPINEELIVENNNILVIHLDTISKPLIGYLDNNILFKFNHNKNLFSNKVSEIYSTEDSENVNKMPWSNLVNSSLIPKVKFLENKNKKRLSWITTFPFVKNSDLIKKQWKKNYPQLLLTYPKEQNESNFIIFSNSDIPKSTLNCMYHQLLQNSNFCVIKNNGEWKIWRGPTLGKSISNAVQTISKWTKEKHEEVLNTIFSKCEKDSLQLKTFLSKCIQKYISQKKQIISKSIKITLPSVSLITITHNRYAFAPLMIDNWNRTKKSYPGFIEWIIVDDSSLEVQQQMKDILPDDCIYIGLNEKESIGQKRNIGVSKSNYDWISCMDDDDFYVEGNLEKRMRFIQNSSFKCSIGFCTSTQCYDLVKDCSFMNLPPLELKYENRISEATLLFNKINLKAPIFEDTNSQEAIKLVRETLDESIEFPPQMVIVSLIHGKNISTRRTPTEMKRTGCLFKEFESEYEKVRGLVI